MDGKKLKKFINNHWLLILIIGVFLLRLPSLFEPHWYGDEGVYLTLGQAIKRGLLLYRDIFDNKPPLIYLLAALASGTIFWFRLFLLTSVLGSLFFFYHLAQKILENEKAARLSTLIFALLTSIRFLEGNIANSELFILLPTTAAFNLIFSLLKEEKRKTNLRNFFVSGAILATAFLLKVPALFDFAALLCFLVFFQKKKFFAFDKKRAALLAGYFLPIFLTAIFFWAKGAFVPFFQACFKQTFGYLFTWKGGSQTFSLATFWKSDLLPRLFFLLATVSGLWLKRKKLNLSLILVALWFVFALFAATLSSRPYAHYLIQVIPSFSLAVGIFLTRKEKLSRALILGFFSLIVLAFVRYRFWTYPTLSYYQNFIQFVLGQKNKTDYFAYFDPVTPQIYQLAEFVNKNTSPQEKIFVWGNEPHIYSLSRRLPVGPYTTAYHILELKQQTYVLTLLEQQSPSIIIVNEQTPPLPSLRSFLKNSYWLVESTKNFTVWQKRL